MNRRDFLRTALSGGAAAGMLAAFGGLGFAGAAQAAGNGRTLVLVFLRGGCDGLNVIVPYGEDAYYRLRPGIGIAAPNAGNALAALDLDGFFGLHPALQSLYPLYRNGWMAAMPAVHFPDASLSHFQAQDTIENGTLATSTSGWLARTLLAGDSTINGRAFSMATPLPRSLLGFQNVAGFRDLTRLQLAKSANDNALLRTLMQSEYNRAPRAGQPYGGNLHVTGRRLLAELDELAEIAKRVPENGATYGGSQFARQMHQAASLIKAREQLEVLTVDMPGWDTHRSQGGGQADGQQSRLLRDYADNLSAFFTDLGAAANRTLVLTITEFGRTAAENASSGTDHGKASAWLALGPGVRGGIHLGAPGWPGLEAGQLDQGRYLAYRTDFRSVYAEALSRHLGVTDPTTVLPNFTPEAVGYLT